MDARAAHTCLHQPRKPTEMREEEIPTDRFFLPPSCILGAVNPSTEVCIARLYDLLGLTWRSASVGPRSQCTCCSAILSHGDIVTPETTLLTVARIWALAHEQGLDHLSTACVTSAAVHLECRETYEHEPGLAEKVDRWLQEACGRRLHIPKAIVHCSDVVYRHRNALAERLRYRLVDRRTGAPLKVVDHVGCHYGKVFPERAVGGAEDCDVLAGLVRAWGGVRVDYPERNHCCGMGFRQCMIRPNRGYTMACVLRKLESMAPYEPDLILTNCPGCNLFLDKEQHAVHELTGKWFDIPVLSYTELAALLLGWDPYAVAGIQAKTVPVEPLLDRIGIPYDKDRMYVPDPTEKAPTHEH